MLLNVDNRAPAWSYQILVHMKNENTVVYNWSFPNSLIHRSSQKKSIITTKQFLVYINFRMKLVIVWQVKGCHDNMLRSMQFIARPRTSSPPDDEQHNPWTVEFSLQKYWKTNVTRVRFSSEQICLPPWYIIYHQLVCCRGMILALAAIATIIPCSALRTQRPSTIQSLNELTSSCRGFTLFQTWMQISWIITCHRIPNKHSV